VTKPALDWPAVDWRRWAVGRLSRPRWRCRSRRGARRVRTRRPVASTTRATRTGGVGGRHGIRLTVPPT